METPTHLDIGGAACRPISESVHPRRCPDAQMQTILDANRAHVQRMLDEARGVTMEGDRFDGLE